MTDEQRRWDRAAEILRGTPGPDARRHIRQRRVLFWAFLGGTVLLALLLGLVVARLTRPSDAGGSDLAPWQVAVGITAGVAGTALAVLALVVLRRSGQLRNPWSSPQSVLSRAQRRDLSRQVLGKAPVDPARLPLARDLAERLSVALRAQLLIFLGLVLVWTSQLISGPRDWRLCFPLASIAMWLVVLPLGLRQARRVHRFLAEHPVDGGAFPRSGGPSRTEG
jgi:hypothetical protein